MQSELDCKKQEHVQEIESLKTAKEKVIQDLEEQSKNE